MAHLRSRPIPNLQDIDLRLLRVFVSVARNRGFSAAQTELNIGQSTISGYISRLEDRLNLKLCVRGRAGFRLTEPGEKLFDAAIDLFDDLDRFRLKVGEAQDALTGNYSIGTVDSVAQVGENLVPNMLSAFLDDAPSLHLDLRLASPQALVRDLLAKRFNAVILPVFRPLSGLRVLELEARNPQVLYCARGHPLYGTSPTEEELRATPFADRAHMEGWAPYTSRALNVSSTTVDVECQLLLILTGKLIGYLPDKHVKDRVASGELWRLPHPNMDYDSRICLAVRPDDDSVASSLLVKATEVLTGNTLQSEG